MNHSFNRSPIVAALDIGTSKVCCIIARVTKEKRVSILGYGYNAAKGIKNGVVTDVNQATIAVCNAVEAAEQMANERITNVISMFPATVPAAWCGVRQSLSTRTARSAKKTSKKLPTKG